MNIRRKANRPDLRRDIPEGVLFSEAGQTGCGRKREERSAEQERRVFHIGTQQMQDSVRSAYDDLYDRTDWLLSSGDREGIQAAQEEMERLWERAVRTGDRALQTAVGHRAAELGLEKLRDAWLATSEEKTKAWGRYVQARQKLDHFKNPQERLWGNLTGGFALRRPPEA